jgi:hypothetical protein
MADHLRLTEADCRNVTWEVVEVTPEYRRSIGRGTHPVTGLPIEVMRTEFLADEALQALNAERRNNTAGKRWSSGMGSEKGGNVPMVHVGSVPLNKYFADFAPRARQGDKDFARWFFNRDENLPFRTREGKL